MPEMSDRSYLESRAQITGSYCSRGCSAENLEPLSELSWEEYTHQALMSVMGSRERRDSTDLWIGTPSVRKKSSCFSWLQQMTVCQKNTLLPLLSSQLAKTQKEQKLKTKITKIEQSFAFRATKQSVRRKFYREPITCISTNPK